MSTRRRDLFFLFLVTLACAAGWICTDMVYGVEVKNTRGVIANERVVELPNDSEKWYLSIVGEDGEARYAEILAWFERDTNLRTLRHQVHFRKIDSDTVIYRARYATNVKGLPTVRLQKHSGEVVYEAAGNSLPLTAEGLYGALANSSSKAQGLGIFRPWRTSPRRRSPVCPDGNCPRPPVQPKPPPEEDPAPAPLDDGGPPEMAAQSRFSLGSAGIGAGTVLLCALVGGGASLVVQWRRKYRQ